MAEPGIVACQGQAGFAALVATHRGHLMVLRGRGAGAVHI
jgi:hypothetical protein